MRIVPNHVCVVVNMLDEVVMVRGDEIIGTLPIAARGSCGKLSPHPEERASRSYNDGRGALHLMVRDARKGALLTMRVRD